MLFRSGEVGNLKIKTENGIPIVYVYAKVEDGIHIPKGSSFFINNLSLLGEKYLEIMPPKKPASGYIKEGDVVWGIDSPPLFNVVGMAYKLMAEMHDFMGGGDIKGLIKKDLSNINDLTLQMSGFLKGVTPQVQGFLEGIRKNQGTIGHLLYDDTLYQKMNALVDDLKKHPWKLFYRPRGMKKRRR